MATETDYAVRQCHFDYTPPETISDKIRIYDYVVETLDKAGRLPSYSYEFKSGRIYLRGKGWIQPSLSNKKSQDVVSATGRQFQTGAYRDTDNNKLDYEAFLSPIVLERYARYMYKNRVQSDGRLRDGDNWQKGIPQGVYIKSAFRHFMDWWSIHRAEQTATPEELEEALCALLFNVQGYLFEQLKKRGDCENRPVAQTLSPRITD